MSRLPGAPTRTMALVAASSPNLQRPRMDERYEAMLYDSDRARAACYASMEDLTDQLSTIVERLESGAELIPCACGEDTTFDEDDGA